MAPEIEVYNFTKTKISKSLTKKILLQALAYFNFKKPVSLAVLVVGKKRMANLNKKWRGKEKAADVLSFPQLSKKELRHTLKISSAGRKLGKVVWTNLNMVGLGEIVLYAEGLNDKKLRHLLVHGLLHLLGFDHQTDKDWKKMGRMEKILMKKSQA